MGSAMAFCRLMPSHKWFTMAWQQNGGKKDEGKHRKKERDVGIGWERWIGWEREKEAEIIVRKKHLMITIH